MHCSQIDDGSHKNSHILKSFDALWPSLAPGGLYFLEDIQLGRYGNSRTAQRHRFDDTEGEAVISDVIQSWVEQKLIPPPAKDQHQADNEANRHASQARSKHPMPAGLAFIFCQAEACVLGKEAQDTVAVGQPCPSRPAAATQEAAAVGAAAHQPQQS